MKKRACRRALISRIPLKETIILGSALHEHRSSRPTNYMMHAILLFSFDRLVRESNKSYHKTSCILHRTNTLKSHKMRFVRILSAEQTHKLRTRLCVVVEEKTNIPTPYSQQRGKLVEKRQAGWVNETEQRDANKLISGPLHIRAKTVIHIENAAIQRYNRNAAGSMLEVGEVFSLGRGDVGASGLAQLRCLLFQLLLILSLFQDGHFFLQTAHQPHNFA